MSQPRVLLAACLMVLACARLPLAAQSSAVGPNAPANQSSAAPPSVVVEFELPADFARRNARGDLVVEALRVGFFVPGTDTVLHSVEVGRAGVEVLRPGVARLRVPLPQVDAAGQKAAIRLQTVTATWASEWSVPTDVVTLPTRPARPPRAAAPAAATPRAATPPATGSGVPTPPAPGARATAPAAGTPPAVKPAPTPRHNTLDAALSEHPALLAALKPLLGPGCDAGNLGLFGRVETLAVVVVLSRQLDVPFIELCKAAPILRRRPITALIRQVKPNVDPERALRVARREARKLLSAPPKG